MISKSLTQYVLECSRGRVRQRHSLLDVTNALIPDLRSIQRIYVERNASVNRTSGGLRARSYLPSVSSGSAVYGLAVAR